MSQTPFVNREDCRRLRRKVSDGSSAREVENDEQWNRVCISRHAYGACGHDAEFVGEPAEATGQATRFDADYHERKEGWAKRGADEEPRWKGVEVENRTPRTVSNHE